MPLAASIGGASAKASAEMAASKKLKAIEHCWQKKT